jgi:uncharacterized protein (TIGR03435 family)
VPSIIGLPAGLLALFFVSQTNPRPAFEVASVKPAPAASAEHRGIKIDAARVDISYWSIRQLILRAYGLWEYQFSGPAWAGSTRFDVVAKLPDGATRDQIPAMLQGLLAERFGLAVHRETKELDAWTLVVAKGGPKMMAAAPDDAGVLDMGRMLDGLWSVGAGADSPFGSNFTGGTGTEMQLAFKKIPVAALAQFIGIYLNTPVIDTTGLKGGYQATLVFSLGDPATVSGSMISAVKQLGLSLERRKTPIEMLVVDHVEQTPKGN